MFAPQKGADSEAVRIMDGYLCRYAELTRQYAPDASSDAPGAGAAGGLGFALMYYMNALLVSGADLIMSETGLEAAIETADIVITGEGCLDSQTAMGKAPVCIARTAKRHGKPVIAFCGAVSRGAELLNKSGIDAYFPVLRQVTTPEQAMERTTACNNLTDTAEQVFRTIKLFSDIT